MEQKMNRPGDSAFKQQKLKPWNFSLSKRTLAIFYLLSGCIWILVGVIIILESNSVIQYSMRYDNIDECKNEWKHPRPCTLEFKLDQKMQSPIFVYYEINNIYQTHRRYIKNRDIKQLMGKDVDRSDLEDRCIDAVTMQDLGFISQNNLLSPNSIASPCGIYPRSYFNDTYEIFPANSHKAQVEIDSEDISWSFNKEEKFKNNEKNKMWISVEKERFINWMDPSGLSTVKKLWGKINDDLEKGKYYVVIHNNYDVSQFSGEKSLVLTTTSSLGGKMIFLGVISLSVGVLAFLFGLCIFAFILLSKRQGVEF